MVTRIHTNRCYCRCLVADLIDIIPFHDLISVSCPCLQDVAVGCIMGVCLLGAGIFSAIIAADWSGISSSDAKAVFGSLVAAVV